jgi:hypothetical protein
VISEAGIEGGAVDMEIAIGDLERLLYSPVPEKYVSYVKQTNAAALRERGFDPKTLCVVNLELKEADKEGWTKGRFFLSGDGCGNYYFVSNTSKISRAKVLLWSHDPPGIEDPQVDLFAFLESAVQENPIIRSIEPKRFCIARTDPIGESILDPILLEEWKQAITQCDAVRYQGYRVGQNPFTGEYVRFELPGLAVAECDGDEFLLQLRYGRVEGDYAKKVRPIAKAVANALEGKLTTRAR